MKTVNKIHHSGIATKIVSHSGHAMKECTGEAKEEGDFDEMARWQTQVKQHRRTFNYLHQTAGAQGSELCVYGVCVCV